MLCVALVLCALFVGARAADGNTTDPGGAPLISNVTLCMAASVTERAASGCFTSNGVDYCPESTVARTFATEKCYVGNLTCERPPPAL